MLRKNSHHNSKISGFTLIEVMVSIIILMVALLGTFQAINLAMDKNLENQLRQKGMAVAEQQLNEIKAHPFSIYSVTGVSVTSSQRVAAGPVFKNFSVARRIADISGTDTHTKQVSVRVWWTYRGRPYEHQVVTSIGTHEFGGR